MASLSFKFPPKLYGGVRLIVDGPCMANVRRLDMGALPMVADMQRNGLYVDVPKLKDFGLWLSQDMKRLEDEAAALTGRRINLNSVPQLAELLFSHIGAKPRRQLKLTKKTKAIQLDDKALSGLLTDPGFRNEEVAQKVILMVQDFRERSKLRGTYVNGVLPFLVPVGNQFKLYPKYKLTTAETGRLAAEDPNVMGIPVRSKLGRMIRACFYAPPGWKMYTVDMSQVEIRYMAWQAGCQSMLDTFSRDGDIHTETSARLFFKMTNRDIARATALLTKLKPHFDTWKKCEDKKRKEVLYKQFLSLIPKGHPLHKFLEAMKPEKRTPSKNLGLGVMYDITGIGLLEQMIKIGLGDQWTEEECDQLILDWFKEYEEVLDDRRLQHRRARQYNFVWDYWGRIRWIPEIRSVHKWVRAQGERAAGNMPVQGGAQGLMKLVMAQARDISDALFGNDNLFLLQIHDELVGMCRDSIVDDVTYMVQDTMANCCWPMSEVVAIKSGSAHGQRWSDLEK